ncbi:MAG: hypothetical protein WC782_00140 [Methylococcaceae bacterium]
MTNIIIASVMVCNLPKFLDGRLVLSGYHGVWEAVEKLPDDILSYFTDDVGNKPVSYGGLLQIIDTQVLEILNDKGFFVCFRGIHEKYLEHVQAYPPKEIYQNLANGLKLLGWDISTGNGWCTASCEGIFPINPFTGEVLDENISQLNEYSLFNDLDNCLNYCHINNEKIPENSPWYPVAIYVDQFSYKRLSAYLIARNANTARQKVHENQGGRLY